uniref:Estrogen receptor binding site associated antigen 9 n=1 Tax=Petromyzon marinus TaxID=7757 RepID=S4RD69_PETMA
MALPRFRLLRLCTCLSAIFALLKRLVCRSGRGRKLSGDSVILPTTVDFSLPKVQTDVQEWSSWDDDAPTSVCIDNGGGATAVTNNAAIVGDIMEPDFFSDMTPTIRKTQKIIVKKKQDFIGLSGSSTLSSRLVASQDQSFLPPTSELGELDTWPEGRNAWEEEGDASWEADEVLRQQRQMERERRTAEQLRKKVEKDILRAQRKEHGKIAVKLS